MMGATMTPTGTPASASALMASSRLGGVGARGSILRARAVERGDGDGDLGQAARRHAGQDVDVAHHQRRLGDDADRVAGAVQHLEDRAGDAALALDRLVGVGDGAERDVLRHVARIGRAPAPAARRR